MEVQVHHFIKYRGDPSRDRYEFQEKLGEGVELIQTTSRNGEHFYGLRVWLKTCQPLPEHSTPEDDDRSAVTFWADENSTGLIDLVSQMQNALREQGQYDPASNQPVAANGSVRRASRRALYRTPENRNL